MNDELLFLGGLLLLLLGSGKKDDGKEGPGTVKPTGPKPDPGPKTPDKIAPIDPVAPPAIPTIPDMVNPDGYPSAGTFYEVQQGDTMLGIAKRALTEAAFLTAKELGNTDDAALAFASSFATGARQFAMAKAITCSSWNDATVTTYGYGDNATPGSSGRAVRLLKKHAANLLRMQDGLPPERRMHRGTPGDQSNGVRRGGSGAFYETLYIPSIDRSAIAQGDGLKIGGEKWPDGSSKANPPKWVLALGVDDTTGTEPKGTKKRGCGSNKVAIRVF